MKGPAMCAWLFAWESHWSEKSGLYACPTVAVAPACAAWAARFTRSWS